MPRIDLTASELHALLAPVLPHAATDKERPELGVVHLEARDGVLSAVASDRFTLGATRHPAPDTDDFTLTIERTDADNLLRIFKHTKKTDPHLVIVVEEMPVPADTGTAITLGIRIDSETGKRHVVQDQEHVDAIFSKWRSILARVLARPTLMATPAVAFPGWAMARWAKAPGKGEHLQVFPGPTPSDPVLVTAGESFMGLWIPVALTGEPAQLLQGSPWAADLAGEVTV